jgi:nicotinic acid mononucleotide adenylyltransferase
VGKKIVIFGGGLNPPGMHHFRLVFDLLRLGFEVVIVPSGNRRPDKLIVEISPEDRIELMKLGFKFFLDSGVVRLDLHDLERGVFSRTHELQERYATLGEIWHLVGADWIIGGRFSGSRIQLEWFQGREIWGKYNFLVSKREGYDLIPEDLPPRCQLVTGRISGSSTEIRERITRGQPITGLVVPEVEKYILEHGLFLPKGKGHEEKDPANSGGKRCVGQESTLPSLRHF